MSMPKITTHVVHVGRNYDRFSVDIDGVYLFGPNGSYSLFGSRKEAKEEALRRFKGANIKGGAGDNKHE